mgnify:CR=1 FL=1
MKKTTKIILAAALLALVAVGMFFALLTPYFRMACVVGFMILFVGVVVLVVRSVIAQAVRIKDENDFTI